LQCLHEREDHAYDELETTALVTWKWPTWSRQQKLSKV